MQGTFKSSQCAVCYGDFAATDEIRVWLPNPIPNHMWLTAQWRNNTTKCRGSPFLCYLTFGNDYEQSFCITFYIWGPLLGCGVVCLRACVRDPADTSLPVEVLRCFHLYICVCVCVCVCHTSTTSCAQILRCKHMFHRECVDEWLTTQRNSCPMCNKPVVID